MVHPLPSGYDTPLVFISVSTPAQAPTFGPGWGPSHHLISSTFQYGLLQSQESPAKGLENIKLSAVKQLSTTLLISQPTSNFYRLFNLMTEDVSSLSSVNMSCNKTEPEKQNTSLQTHKRIKMFSSWKGRMKTQNLKIIHHHAIQTLFYVKPLKCTIKINRIILCIWTLFMPSQNKPYMMTL